MVEALDIWVKGIVQGVGFRPFVYRLAKRYLISGWVLNATDGVHIHAEGESQHLDEFVMALSEDAPAAAQVTEIEMHEVPLEPFSTFEIRFSDDDSTEDNTLVSSDLATCADCERELFDPQDRRFRYPFINCTNCGPRFTITEKLPYDRANTSMHVFPMCEACAAEYADPADRRFHAQPDACFECGPHLIWRTSGEGQPDEVARTREESDALIGRAVKLLQDGGILAVKGLGGYHLACDANNEQAVSRLRKLKGRDGKAFAVMMRTPEDARQVCHVSPEEEALLTGSARPIVLLIKRESAPVLAPSVSGQLPELGVMLPYTPVQHLLLHDLANATPTQDADGGASPVALVMTSGNVHDEPICITNEEAYQKLSGIADAFLANDRDILTRFDDSVVRVLDLGEDASAIQFIRRARGYAPAPLSLNEAVNTATSPAHVFAAGPEQKNTFCYLRGGQAFVSQYIGDVENAEVFDAWHQAKARYQQLFGLAEQALACDLHPEYLTTKWAHEQAALTGQPLTQVQHHHAHIVAAMAEAGVEGPVCGIAFDGTGFGADGNIWGGEVLISNTRAYERFANFAYVPMPGGAACVKHPLRMAYGVLWESDLLEHPGAARALAELGEEQAAVCERMIEQGLNTPVTSSAGRLFDAASALLGVCTEPTYEGEAAILLEAVMGPHLANTIPAGQWVPDERYQVAVTKNTASEGDTAETTAVVLLDASPVFQALLDDVEAGVPVGVIARRFHDAMVGAVLTSAQMVDALYGIRDVVLTGGVFMNRYLVQNAASKLADAGFNVILNGELPPNDSCVSLGQATVAATR